MEVRRTPGMPPARAQQHTDRAVVGNRVRRRSHGCEGEAAVRTDAHLEAQTDVPLRRVAQPDLPDEGVQTVDQTSEHAFEPRIGAIGTVGSKASVILSLLTDRIIAAPRRPIAEDRPRKRAMSNEAVFFSPPGLVVEYGAMCDVDFAMDDVIDRAGSPLAARETLATSVYDRLHADILTAALTPGQKLRVEYVCDRYQAGSSPVREALSRLSAHGLVERKEQRGFYVAPVSATDLEELTKTRCWIEGIALSESIASGDEAWEEAIVLAFHRLFRISRSLGDAAYRANPEWERRHGVFHDSLIAACGSRWLLQFCTQLRDQAYRYRHVAAATIFPKRNERAEHEAIMNATIDRDVENAVRLLHKHYRRTTEIILSRPECLAIERPARRVG
jgi:DNA-binding GntR family transcriptional regulator